MDPLRRFIIVLDIGTTNLKCHLFSDSLKLVYNASFKMSVSSPTYGYAEINPDSLWHSIVKIVDKCFHDTRLSPYDIACLGLSCHRNTFITWDRNTNIPFHTLITWKDSRASEAIDKLNKSLFFRIFKFICYCLYFLTGSQRFLAASLMKFTTAQVTGRLLWMLKNNTALKAAIKDKTAMFGTLDTWLLYMLTNGSTYCTDVSSASSTGMYDPFTCSWSPFMKFLGIPVSILPEVSDSAGFHFGRVSSKIWGSKIPITCILADQAAALYGAQCLDPGQLKITLGTGAFLDVNVGCKPVASKLGLYPLICWKYEEKSVYALEIGCHDCSSVINWLLSLGFCENIKFLSSMAKLVPDTNGVYFIPAFSGLQFPVENFSVGSGFIGVKENTKREHLIRAVLEGIIYRLYELFTIYQSDGRFVSDAIKVNGGVSNNNFICQTLADICDKKILRSLDPDTSARGVALLASQVIGTYNLDHVIDDSFETFFPNSMDGQCLRKKFVEWDKARSRFSNWYPS